MFNCPAMPDLYNQMCLDLARTVLHDTDCPDSQQPEHAIALADALGAAIQGYIDARAPWPQGSVVKDLLDDLGAYEILWRVADWLEKDWPVSPVGQICSQPVRDRMKILSDRIKALANETLEQAQV